MQLDNETQYAAALVPGWSTRERPQLTCVVKTAWHYNANGRLKALSAEDAPLTWVDEFENDDPETGAIRCPADTAPFKAGFEWLLHGTFVAPENATCQDLTVVWRDAKNHKISAKTIRATGTRQWQRHLFGRVPSEPLPIKDFQLSYRRAFGGQTQKKNGKSVLWPKNPIGQGYGRTDATLLPEFEQAPFIQSLHDQREPAGFGALSPLWEPRQAGWLALDTEAAEKGLCPYQQPLDPNLYNAAPRDQQWSSYTGSNQVSLFGFHDQPLSIELPDLSNQWRCLVVQEGVAKRLSLVCDTALIDTEKQTIALLWRVGFDWRSDQAPPQVLLQADNAVVGVAV